MIFRGDIQGDAADPRRAATNPTVLIEVLSETTEEYDRGEKPLRRRPVLRGRDLLKPANSCGRRRDSVTIGNQ